MCRCYTASALTDYRSLNGVMVAYPITSHYMEEQSEFRLATVEINPAMDAAVFERPGAK